jgi:hypothetical protein
VFWIFQEAIPALLGAEKESFTFKFFLRSRGVGADLHLADGVGDYQFIG